MLQIICLILAACSALGAPPGPGDSDRDSKQVPAGRTFQIAMPTVLSEPQLSALFEGLVEEQRRDRFEEAKAAVLFELEQFADRRIAPLVEQTSELALSSNGNVLASVEMSQAFADLIRQRNRLDAACSDAERTRLDRLADVLELDSDARVAVNQRYSRIQRARCRAIPSGLPPARLDLDELMLSLRGPGPGSEPLSPEALRILAVYGEELADLRTQWQRAMLRQMAEDGLLYHAMAGDAAAFLAKRRQLSGTRMRLERLIVQANGDWLTRIAEQLEPESARRLRDRYLAQAFPAVYPNPFDLRQVIAEVSAIDPPPSSADDAMTLLLSYQSRMDEHSSQMERACMDIWQEWGETRARVSGSGSVAEQVDAAMAPLRRKRLAEAAEAVGTLRGSEVLSGMPAWRALVERLEAHGDLP